MKNLPLILIPLLLSLNLARAQSTNTNALWTTNRTMIVIRTNIPFVLSEYPGLSGVSNVLGNGNAIFPSFHPTTNVWANAGTVDLSTNQSYGFTIDSVSGNITITGFTYTGSFATNDPCSTIWFTNHDNSTHTVTVPTECRTTTGARVNYVTNAQVSQYEFHLGYGMTNLIIRNFW